MDYLTHNDLLWLTFSAPDVVFQCWVMGMACDGAFEWPDGPLDAPIV